jgi:hypothetical protein
MSEEPKPPAEGQPPEKTPKKSKTNLPSKQARRISKTMLEGSVDLELMKATGEPPKIAKTLIDQSIDRDKVASAAQTSQPSAPNQARKVAKTLIDQSIGPEQVIDATTNLEVAKTLPDPDVDADHPARSVAKTVLDKSLPQNPAQGSRSSIDGLAKEQAIPAAIEELLRAQSSGGKSAAPPSAPTPNPVPVPLAPRLPRRASRNLIKTLHEFSFKATADSDRPSLTVSPDLERTAEPSPKGVRRATRQYVMVARTMLDHDAFYKEVDKSSQKKGAKVAEDRAAALVTSAPHELQPVVERIKGDKLAASCPWSWDGDGKDKFRQCGRCQATVYNFADMSRSEVEELILVRENRKKFTLFERADGKFMTGDCPIESQRRQRTTMVTVVGVFCLLVIIAAFVFMPPPPPPKPVDAMQPIGPAINSGKTTKLPVAIRRPDGSLHYQAGQTAAPTALAPVSPVAQPVKKDTSPDPDENGGFWQYANPQSAEMESTVSGSH